jgi:hypothetical protein
LTPFIGDSYGRKGAAKQFTAHLIQWLQTLFPGTFENRGDILPHPRQSDYIHCGIYTANNKSLLGLFKQLASQWKSDFKFCSVQHQ